MAGNAVLSPVIYTAHYPYRLTRSIDETLTTRGELEEEIRSLRHDLLLNQARLQKMDALAIENTRLRNLLGSSVQLEDEVRIVEVIGEDPDPERHELIIDKGSLDGVFMFQSVLDASGLTGQVVETAPTTSRVMMVSDPRHSVPVQVARNNLRLIAQGTGRTDRLDVLYVQETADLKPGDLLLTSGLAERFPAGYPVARINLVSHDPGEPFARVQARPTALLDRSRHLVLVIPGEKRSNPAEKSPSADPVVKKGVR